MNPLAFTPEELFESDLLSTMNKDNINSQIATQLYLAGRVSGLAERVDARVLEAYIDSKPEGFRYEEICRKVVELAKASQAQSKRGT